MSKNSRGTNHFKEEWCTKDRFKAWLARSNLKDLAKCNLCNNHFSIANAGISEIDSHRKGKRHRELESNSKSLSKLTFKNPKEVTQPSASSSEINLIPLDVVLAEIRFSYRSCLGLNDLFKVIFAKDPVAQNFQMSKTIKVFVLYKLSYRLIFQGQSFVRYLALHSFQFLLTKVLTRSLNLNKWTYSIF